MRPREKPEIGLEEELKIEKARPKEMEMDDCGREKSRKKELGEDSKRKKL